LGTRSIKNTSKAWALDTAISMISMISMVDLTTLEGADTEAEVRSLCAKAMAPDPCDPTTPMSRRRRGRGGTGLGAHLGPDSDHGLPGNQDRLAPQGPVAPGHLGTEAITTLTRVGR
jgi:hypothetical protein